MRSDYVTKRSFVTDDNGLCHSSFTDLFPDKGKHALKKKKKIVAVMNGKAQRKAKKVVKRRRESAYSSASQVLKYIKCKSKLQKCPSFSVFKN